MSCRAPSKVISHHLIRALTPFDMSAHIKWCEMTLLAYANDIDYD